MAKLYTNRNTVFNDHNRYWLATYHKRLLAFLIDVTFLILIVFFLFQLLKFYGIIIRSIDYHGFTHVNVKVDNLSAQKIKFLKIGLALLPTFYFSATTYFTNGYTLGKWICRIRIHSLYHHRISLWHCIERSLGYVASSLEFGLGFLQIFWNPNRMALHDRIAETIVIKINKHKED